MGFFPQPGDPLAVQRPARLPADLHRRRLSRRSRRRARRIRMRAAHRRRRGAVHLPALPADRGAVGLSQADIDREYSLDVRDNEEGELSILKSELYKMTVMLSENAGLLQREKTELADSLADISHQLKTPLTSMMVMADLLQDAQLPAAKREEFTERIRAQLERIQWLVSSLLKMSKLDAGVVTFRLEAVPVRSLLEKAAAPFSSRSS